MSSHREHESEAQAEADLAERIYTSRARLGMALFALQHRVDELLPVNAQDLTWRDLAAALPRDLTEFGRRLRRLELAVFDLTGAYEQAQRAKP